MNNGDIARILSEIGAMLEIKGESVFKVRAYERAAEALRNLPEFVGDVRERGELRTIRGVGESIALKVEELLDTGRLRYYEQLQQEFPRDTLELLRVPGVGPKTVKVLVEQAGITTLEQLEVAAQEGQLRAMRGMGEKTEQEILRGIAQIRSFGQRATLGEAFALAQEIVDQLRASAPVDQMEPAGSVRRMKDSIGDIDILATSSQPEKVMDCFVGLGLVSRVIMRGPTKSTVLTHSGLQADIRVVAPESFGAALQYFTGSKDHNVALRELAGRQSIKINEYGVFRVKDGAEQRLGGSTEEEVYAAVGLPYIPPELREDQGEIEAAQQGALPHPVELSDIRGDLQVHSTWSDGKSPILEVVRASKALGYAYVAITDHSPAQAIANGLPVSQLPLRLAEIEEVRRAVRGITVLNATEVDITRDGALDYPDEVLQQFDFVIASVHSGWKMGKAEMTRRLLRAIESPWVDAIAHPTGRIIGRREPYDVDLDAVCRAAAQRGVAMEINAFPDRLDLKDTHARRAKSLGAKLLISTDAHAADQLPVMRFGVATARRGWIEAGDVLNTLPLLRFRRALRRNRKK